MVGQLIADRYELEELVGTGGMSSVFRARDTLLERRVALKILHEQYTRDESYVERFRREARAVAQLSHPNIVTVIDRGEHEGRQFIVFEFVAGQNLKELIREQGPLPVREAIGLALQVARALAFAHQQGVVHRDVKPQNVLLNGDGRAKVTDFGIARSLDGQGMTQTGTVLGTSDYIAPEQARGAPVEPQTDVYSLAIVLYELLTGEVPFSGDNFVAVAMRHVNEPPPHVVDKRPDVPLRLDDALQRAMAKDARDRFRSMDEFVAELEACLAAVGDAREPEDPTMILPAPPLPAPPRARRRRSRWPAIVAAVLVAVIAAVAAAIVLSRSDGGGGGTTVDDPGGTPSVSLAGAGSYDPAPGDGSEHPERVEAATDGDAATYWTTERYRTWGWKPGVGLVVDAGRPATLDRIRVVTDTPGFTAQIRAGDAVGGPFTPVSAARSVGDSTLFELDVTTPARYYVVWITDLDSFAHVNEVRAA
jgi:serine/threonine-protein kinase